MTTSHSYDIAVVGAGVFGAWTAHRLQSSGASVVLMDQYGAGNSRASSGGETRIMRLGYGPDEIYMSSAKRSLELWRELFRQSEQRLFHRTGVLWMAREDDEYSRSTIATFERAQVAFEKLTRAQLSERYPQIEFGPVNWGILEPESGAVMARQAVRSVVERAKRNGVNYLSDAVLPPTGVGSLESLATLGGREVKAGTFVFACGPWLPKVFPEVLGKLIHVTRQEIFFFGVPAGDGRFSPDRLPIWIDFNDLIYAIPDIDGRGLKVAIDAHGPEFDPDTGDRVVTTEGLTAARRYLSQRVPALANAPLLESRVCQYENTSNGDFLIDRHPSLKNVWLVGGGSGHGFKHGPAVAEYAAGLISGHGRIEPRFTLATKEPTQHRQVF